MNLPEAKPEPTPPGKRTVRENIWGNIVGYVSGRRFREFGTISSWSRAEAEAWRKGEDQ